MKYRPEFPDRFGCIQDSRTFGHSFFAWYNDQHRHSGLALLTPAMVHFGSAPDVVAQRQVVLDAAFQAHPERFVRKPPIQAQPQLRVWINKPPDSGEYYSLNSSTDCLKVVDTRRQAYSQAATTFRHFKDAWRNHVSHSRIDYDENKAGRIFDSVKLFMQDAAALPALP